MQFNGSAGFVRRGTVPLRLMFVGGTISADGVTLSSPDRAALLNDGKSISVYCDGRRENVQISLPEVLKALTLHLDASETMNGK